MSEQALAPVIPLPVLVPPNWALIDAVAAERDLDAPAPPRLRLVVR